MRFKTLLTLAVLSLVFGTTLAQTQTGATDTKPQTAAPDAQAQATPQPQDQKVIDDFVTTRGVSFEDVGKKSTPPPKPAGASTGNAHKNNSGGASSQKGSSVAQNSGRKKPTTAGKGTTGKGTTGSDGVAESDANGASLVNADLHAIGLGYTVYMREDAGGLLPVDPAREYKSGERIAITLEPNTEGYIYIFNASDDRDPMMLFPNVMLDAGANVAHAHVRETYPADVNYSFEFDNNPAIENVYVIVSRHPLEGVLTGDALMEFCGKNNDDCYWKPTAEQWARIKSGAAGGRVIEAKNGTLLAQASRQAVQPGSIQRGFKIKKEEPAPAVVRVNDSPLTDSLVTVIKLVHK
jgi:hypothetical protein